MPLFAPGPRSLSAMVCLLLASPATLAAARGEAAPPSPAPGPAPILVLYHADLDGRLGPVHCGAGPGAGADYAALVATLAAARDEVAHTPDAPDATPTPVVTLLGGNQAAPDPFAAAWLARGAQGARDLAALFARGRYDAVALGHHELSLEPAALDALVPALAQAGLPVVASNLRCDGRRPICAALRRDVLVRRGAVTVGVLAVIAPSVQAGIPPGRLAGLTLEDPLPAIRDGVRRLRARGAERVVLMVQGPRDARALDEADALQRRLADGPAPDVILAGGLADEDSGRALWLVRRDGSPALVGSPAAGAGISRVRLAGADVTVDSRRARADQLDPDTSAMLRSAEAAACTRAAESLARAPIHGQLQRADFVTYVLEVMRRQTGAEIAVINSAFVKRGPFPMQGTFTRGDFERALPYRAELGAARVQGPVVESVLGAALGNPKLAVAGLTRGDGGLQVNGRPLDKARAYRVATIAFVAEGGDGIFAPHALPFRALAGAPDVRDRVADFLRRDTALKDGDPTVDVATDFGRPARDTPLWVTRADVGFDLASTSISNPASYGDAQLARAQQLALKGQATVVGQLRHPAHEVDARGDLQYGWTRTQPPGMPQTSAETADLITATALYTYRGLRDWRRIPRRFVPDPYVRAWLESEVTRPALTDTQTRAFHHLQLTSTAGAQLTLTPRFKVRGGAGAQSELLAPGPAGDWHAVVEAGLTVDPTAVATWGELAVKLEGLASYDFVDPSGTRQHQIRTTWKLSVPLVPYLFVTAGLDVFAVERQRAGWGASYDTTVGLRAHTDFARQSR